MEKQIIAARVLENKLLAVRTLEDPIISKEDLIFKIKMGESFFALIKGKKVSFVLDASGEKFSEPSPKELIQINQF